MSVRSSSQGDFSNPALHCYHLPQKNDYQSKDTVNPELCNQRITLCSDSLSLGIVLQTIAEAIGAALIYGEDVDKKQSISCEFDDVSVQEALHRILHPLGYSFSLNKNDLFVSALETRQFFITLPLSFQSFTDTTSNESFSGPAQENSVTGGQNIKIGTKIFVENKNENVSVWKDISDNVSKMISPKGKYSINQALGVISVTDGRIILERIAQYITLLNKMMAQQIMVDVKVCEVTLDDNNQYGVDWNIIQEKIGKINTVTLATNFVQGNIAAASTMLLNASGPRSDSGTKTNGVNAVVRALETQGNVELLSQPKIVLLNHQTAVIQVGTTTAYIDQIDTETTQSGGTINSVSTSQVHEGLTMRLAVNIDGREIYLCVTPVITTIDQIRQIEASKDSIIEAPQVSTKSLSTLVKCNDQETVLIGGLITTRKERKSEGIPFFSKLPLIGGLFGFQGYKTSRRELIIFITPKKLTV